MSARRLRGELTGSRRDRGATPPDGGDSPPRPTWPQWFPRSPVPEARRLGAKRASATARIPLLQDLCRRSSLQQALQATVSAPRNQRRPSRTTWPGSSRRRSRRLMCRRDRRARSASSRDVRPGSASSVRAMVRMRSRPWAGGQAGLGHVRSADPVFTAEALGAEWGPSLPRADSCPTDRRAMRTRAESARVLLADALDEEGDAHVRSPLAEALAAQTGRHDVDGLDVPQRLPRLGERLLLRRRSSGWSCRRVR